MKKVSVLIFVCMLFCCTQVLAVEETKAQSGSSFKFGTVDLTRALNESVEGKAAQETIQAEFNARQQKLDILQNELKTMKEDLEKKRLILSADALKTKEDEFRNKFMELQQKLATFKQEMAEKEGALTTGVLEKLRKIVSEVGAKDGYSMIFEKSQGMVLYAPAADDLTTKVVELCNKTKGTKK